MDADGVRRAGEAEGPARHRRSIRSAAPTSAATERALIAEYRASIDEVLRALEPGNLALAVEIARIRARLLAHRDAARRGTAGTRLTEAVARYHFKLMAYKDEYEGGRLYAETARFQEPRVTAQFEGELATSSLTTWRRRRCSEKRPGELTEAAASGRGCCRRSGLQPVEGPARHGAGSLRL